jgi:hypothetical protein
MIGRQARLRPKILISGAWVDSCFFFFFNWKLEERKIKRNEGI